MKPVELQARKDPNDGKLKIMIEVDEDDSTILNQSIKSFEKYDKDDKKYVPRLKHVEEQIHIIWALLHPS